MISFVIPVYCSALSLTELYLRIFNQFENIEGGFEIIFIDDCSDDNSWDVIKNLAENSSFIRGFSMSRNYGQHNAILCGIREASGDIIVTLDDDLQHLPEEIPKLIAKFKEGYDVVYGPPEIEQHSFLRNLASIITKIGLKRLMGAENARNVSALRVFKSNLKNAFSNYNSPTVNIDVLLAWSTKNFSSIKVKHDIRKHGESGYTTQMLVQHALNMMTGFSVRPLQLASMMGFFFAGFGFILLGNVLINWLLQGSIVPGFSFLAAVITIFSGAQLIALGIIGEYLARVHLRTIERPPYFVSNFTSSINQCQK